MGILVTATAFCLLGRAGLQLSTTLAPGTWNVTAYVWNDRTARWEDARSVTVTVK